MAARLSRAIAALVVLAAVLGGCGAGAGGGPGVTFPPQTFGPGGTPTPAVLGTRALIADALGQRGIVLDDPESPRRPAESPSLVPAPRGVFQAVLPDDPGRGYISVYDLGDPSRAFAAAQEQAEYVGSPVGRVQFPTGTQFVVRQVGTTVVFYSAVPGGSEDPLAREIPGALETLGSGIPVPG